MLCDFSRNPLIATLPSTTVVVVVVVVVVVAVVFVFTTRPTPTHKFLIIQIPHFVLAMFQVCCYGHKLIKLIKKYTFFNYHASSYSYH